tara:strand:- start:945 stop:1139 length:195 start_codon:yes stop_codon:yes gene_type:complete
MRRSLRVARRHLSDGRPKSWIQRDHIPGEAKLREKSERLLAERQSQLCVPASARSCLPRRMRSD